MNTTALIACSVLALGAAAFLTGCGSGFREGFNDAMQDATPNVSAENVKPWPLTVPEAYVECEPVEHTNYARAFVRVGKQRYTLNGHAKSAHPDLPNVTEIWADNPDRPGQKIPIDNLIKAALSHCKS